MADVHELLLDLFPLCSPIAEESPFLAQELHRTAFALSDALAHAHRLRSLLLLCRDLGYLDEDVYRYLCKSIDQAFAGTRR